MIYDRGVDEKRAPTEGPRGGRLTARLVVWAVLYAALVAYLVYIYLGLRSDFGVLAAIILATLAAIAFPIVAALPAPWLQWIAETSLDHPDAFVITRGVLAFAAWALLGRLVAASL
jgi:hypothetical protein